MAFHEIKFPTNISLGSRSGPGFSTYITELDSGAEQRIARRSTPQYKFDVSYGVKTHIQLAALRTFYNARLGCANGFRYQDFLDYASTADGLTPPNAGAVVVTNADQNIGTGDGSKTQFQLIKTYSDAAGSTQRIITKPVHTNGAGHGGGTVLIAKAGVSQTSGWTVNTVSGIVTFSVAPAIGEAITAGFEFDVPVRFGKEIDDVLSMSIDEWNTGQVGSVPLVELVSPVVVNSDIYYGGADNKTIAANYSLSASDARSQSFTPTGAGLAVLLPPLTDMVAGGPVFYITNESASQTLAIKKSDGTLLDTMPTGPKTWELLIRIDSGGNKVWDFMK